MYFNFEEHDSRNQDVNTSFYKHVLCHPASSKYVSFSFFFLKKWLYQNKNLTMKILIGTICRFFLIIFVSVIQL